MGFWNRLIWFREILNEEASTFLLNGIYMLTQDTWKWVQWPCATYSQRSSCRTDSACGDLNDPKNEFLTKKIHMNDCKIFATRLADLDIYAETLQANVNVQSMVWRFLLIQFVLFPQLGNGINAYEHSKVGKIISHPQKWDVQGTHELISWWHDIFDSWFSGFRI